MRYSIRMQTRISSLALLLALGFVAGCASTVTAPLRDGNGAVPPAATAPDQLPGTHVVRPGETLLAVSRQYGVSLPELVAWNRLSDPNQLNVGQVLRVAPPGAETGAVATAIPLGPEVIPVAPAGGEGMAAGIKQGPIGGRQPYSDEAWAKINPNAAVAPAPAPVEAPKPVPGGSGEWQWPANGVLIAGFNESTNKGVDIAGNTGDPVYASAAGKVVYAGSGLRGYGKLVVIKHNQEYNSVYAHNNKLLVKEDDLVVKGQQIAELGNSEADRSKLHFEIRKQGKAVDPMKYLPSR